MCNEKRMKFVSDGCNLSTAQFVASLHSLESFTRINCGVFEFVRSSLYEFYFLETEVYPI